MISLDTNVVLRLIVEDDPAQCERAAAAFRAAVAAGGVFITTTVLVEVSWVLRVAFKLDRPAIANALRRLIDTEGVTVERVDLVRRATAAYEAGSADFADHVILECSREASALPVLTFDERFTRAPDVALVPPA